MTSATPVIAATYAEIALKGRNRQVFLRRLLNNIRTALKDEQIVDLQHVESRILIRLADAARADAAAAKLQRVFGLQWVSPAVPVPRADVDPELTADAVEIMSALSVEADKTDLVFSLDIEEALLDRLVARAEEQMD